MKHVVTFFAIAIPLLATGAWLARAEDAHRDAKAASMDARVERAELRAATRRLQDAELRREAVDGFIPPLAELPEGFHYCLARDGTETTICSDATGARVE